MLRGVDEHVNSPVRRSAFATNNDAFSGDLIGLAGSDDDNKSVSSSGPSRASSAQPLTPELIAIINAQVAFYFSDINLPTDIKFLRQIMKDPQGFVPLKLFSNYRKIRNITTDQSLVALALRHSKELVLSECRTRVRRAIPVPDYDVAAIQRRTILVEYLLEFPTIELVSNAFSAFGPVNLVRICSKDNVKKLPRWLTDSCSNTNLVHAYVEYESEASVDLAVENALEMDSFIKGLKVSRLRVTEGGMLSHRSSGCSSVSSRRSTQDFVGSRRSARDVDNSMRRSMQELPSTSHAQRSSAVYTPIKDHADSLHSHFSHGRASSMTPDEDLSTHNSVDSAGSGRYLPPGARRTASQVDGRPAREAIDRRLSAFNTQEYASPASPSSRLMPLPPGFTSPLMFVSKASANDVASTTTAAATAPATATANEVASAAAAAISNDVASTTTAAAATTANEVASATTAAATAYEVASTTTATAATANEVASPTTTAAATANEAASTTTATAATANEAASSTTTTTTSTNTIAKEAESAVSAALVPRKSVPMSPMPTRVDPAEAARVAVCAALTPRSPSPAVTPEVSPVNGSGEGQMFQADAHLLIGGSSDDSDVGTHRGGGGGGGSIAAAAAGGALQGGGVFGSCDPVGVVGVEYEHEHVSPFGGCSDLSPKPSQEGVDKGGPAVSRVLKTRTSALSQQLSFAMEVKLDILTPVKSIITNEPGSTAQRTPIAAAVAASPVPTSVLTVKKPPLPKGRRTSMLDSEVGADLGEILKQRLAAESAYLPSDGGTSGISSEDEILVNTSEEERKGAAASSGAATEEAANKPKKKNRRRSGSRRQSVDTAGGMSGGGSAAGTPPSSGGVWGHIGQYGTPGGSGRRSGPNSAANTPPKPQGGWEHFNRRTPGTQDSKGQQEGSSFKVGSAEKSRAGRTPGTQDSKGQQEVGSLKVGSVEKSRAGRTPRTQDSRGQPEGSSFKVGSTEKARSGLAEKSKGSTEKSKKPAKKDYASWAAATPEYRALTAARSGGGVDGEGGSPSNGAGFLSSSPAHTRSNTPLSRIGGFAVGHGEHLVHMARGPDSVGGFAPGAGRGRGMPPPPR